MFIDRCSAVALVVGVMLMSSLRNGSEEWAGLRNVTQHSRHWKSGRPRTRLLDSIDDANWPRFVEANWSLVTHNGW
jgi:hypothetical protein